MYTGRKRGRISFLQHSNTRALEKSLKTANYTPSIVFELTQMLIPVSYSIGLFLVAPVLHFTETIAVDLRMMAPLASLQPSSPVLNEIKPLVVRQVCPPLQLCESM